MSSEFAEQLKQAKEKNTFVNNEFDLPVGGKGDPAPEEATEVAAKETPAEQKPVDAPPEAPKKQYKLAGKLFDSQEEALAYAEELAIQQREEEAAIAALRAAQEAQKPQPVKKSLEDEVEEILFENPKEAIRKLRAGIKEEIENEQRTSRQKAERVAHERQVWDQFYGELAEKHPDVGWNREIAEFYASKLSNEIMDIPVAKAQDLIAEKMRASFKRTKEAGAKAVELKETATVVAPPSSPVATQNDKVQENQPLDFISQVRKLRKNS